MAKILLAVHTIYVYITNDGLKMEARVLPRYISLLTIQTQTKTAYVSDKNNNTILK
jgi:hypothetical protein